MLHRFQCPEYNITGHDPNFLRQCLETLRQHKFNLVSVDDILDANRAGRTIENAVAFTVDDGYFDHAEIGGAVFAEYDCPATFYLVTDFVNGDFWPEDAKIKYLFETTAVPELDWRFAEFSLTTPLKTQQQRQIAAHNAIWATKNLPFTQMQQATQDLAKHLEIEIPTLAPDKFRAMSWEQAKALEKRGMRFGAHTRKHVTLSKEDDISARAQIGESVQAVRKHLHNPSNIFCYPTGRPEDFGQRDMDIVEDLGLAGALSTDWGYHDQSANRSRFSIPRIGMPGGIQDFHQIIYYIELFKEGIRKKF